MKFISYSLSIDLFKQIYAGEVRKDKQACAVYAAYNIHTYTLCISVMEYLIKLSKTYEIEIEIESDIQMGN